MSVNTLWKTNSALLPVVLRGYDLAVAHGVSRFLWRCPATVHIAQYNKLARGRHLEIGPGSAFYLVTSEATRNIKNATLVDLAEEPLAFAKSRLEGFVEDVETLVADVTRPLPSDSIFDSVALNHVLHCVPGNMSRKLGGILSNLAPVMSPDAVLFGSTVLARTHPGHTRASAIFVDWLNSRGIFHNADDTLDAVHHTLGAHFRTVDVRHIGAEAVFAARDPQATAAAAAAAAASSS
ncbi:hypothetical protein CTAYLR_002759 [Chrysophaeum taylorii]|uniref:Methyltransferase type 11 domain-containing protein n=1 Tax=Chrysophaeum taylorii TaxID=2483200 RepID=A0AAD7UDM0_9STRA|nr:hypothetical protein CTAYLR_002759 [Chrysophaeum taylorii]